MTRYYQTTLVVAGILRDDFSCFLQCSNFLEEATILLGKVYEINYDTLTSNKILLFDNLLFNQFDNNRILNAITTFIVASKIFDSTPCYSD